MDAEEKRINDETTKYLRIVNRGAIGFIVCLITLAISALLTGCTSEADVAHLKKLKTEPEITKIGTYDDCEVKYVNRGDRDNSFFLAKCDNTQTITQQYSVSSGKSSVQQTRVSITQQIKQLQGQAEVLRLRDEALLKLTPAERKVLGIPEEVLK